MIRNILTIFLLMSTFASAQQQFTVALENSRLEQDKEKNWHLILNFTTNLPDNTMLEIKIETFKYKWDFKGLNTMWDVLKLEQFQVLNGKINYDRQLPTMGPGTYKITLTIAPVQFDKDAINKLPRNLFGKQIESFQKLVADKKYIQDLILNDIRNIENFADEFDSLLTAIISAKKEDYEKISKGVLEKLKDIQDRIKAHGKNSFLTGVYDYMLEIAGEFEMAATYLEHMKEAEERLGIDEDPTDPFNYHPQPPAEHPPHPDEDDDICPVPPEIEGGYVNSKYLKALIYSIKRATLREASAWVLYLTKIVFRESCNNYYRAREETIDKESFTKGIDIARSDSRALRSTLKSILARDVRSYLKGRLQLKSNYSFQDEFFKEFDAFLAELARDVSHSEGKETAPAIFAAKEDLNKILDKFTDQIYLAHYSEEF